MKIPQSFYSLLGAIFLLLATSIGYAQDEKKIDSLKNELIKFEAHKKELGANASKFIDTNKISILNKIITQTFKINPLDALDYVNEELEIAKRTNHKWGISHSNNILGAIYDYKGDYKKAMDHYNEALKVKKEINDQYGQVDIHINMGVLYTKQFEYTQALSSLLQGLEIAKKLKDKYGIFGAYNNIGILYKAQQKYDEAIKSYLSCLKLQLELKDEYFIGTTYQNIGEAYFGLNQFDKAQTYYEQGIKVASKAKNIEALANNYDGLGKIFQHKKEYQKAYDNFEIALKLRQDMQDVLGVSYSYMHIGDIFYEEGDYEKALFNIHRSLVVSKKLGELSSMSFAYDILSKIYNKKGNYKLAYENHLLYKATNDSIFNLERDKKLSEMQLKYNAKSIRDSLQTIQDKKELLRKEESRIEKKTTNYIYSVLSVILIFLIVLLVQRNKIETIKRQKALEEERNRISRNLHDDLGAQLSAVRMFISSIKNQNDKSKIEETVENSLGLLDLSIQELRNIMNDIHSSVLQEQGYLGATEVLVNKINQLHLIKFSLSHYNIDKRFDSKIEHELYRVTQELVNNTLKYAEAENVFIELLKRDGNLIFMYEDDGKGYDYQTIKKGNGLDNIEARIQSVGGNVTFDTTPGTGARTIIEIPL